jgi:hypothetical protein
VGPIIIPDRPVLILFAHEKISLPALTTGAFVNKILTVSTTCAQLPLFVDVKYKFTNPAEI